MMLQSALLVRCTEGDVAFENQIGVHLRARQHANPNAVADDADLRIQQRQSSIALRAVPLVAHAVRSVSPRSTLLKS